MRKGCPTLETKSPPGATCTGRRFDRVVMYFYEDPRRLKGIRPCLQFIEKTGGAKAVANRMMDLKGKGEGKEAPLLGESSKRKDR